MKPSTALIGFIALSVTALLVPDRAHGFSDPTLFEEVASKGGSSGRQFTGAPDDPFTCVVCHGSGEASFDLRVEGWPREPSESGAYDLRIALPGPDTSVAFQLEVQADGAPGTLELLPDSELLASERCDGELDGSPAAYVREVGGRFVLGVSDCGAALVRIRLTTPSYATLQLWAAGVLSDGEADVLGDRVAEVSLSAGVVRDDATGCSTRGNGHVPLWAAVFVVGIIPKKTWLRLCRETPIPSQGRRS